MEIINQISLGLLALAFVIQVGARSFLARHIKFFWIISFLLIFGMYAHWSLEQYLLWKSDSFTKLFLPPYNSISYYLYYIGTRFFAPPALALVAAVILYAISIIGNAKFGERFFEDEEPLVATLAVLLVGYPGFLFYIPAMLISGVILSFFHLLTGQERASLYFLWLPVAFFVIISMRVYFAGIVKFFGL